MLVKLYLICGEEISQPEITLSCKTLKFVPTANNIDWVKLKTELEEYRRKLQVIQHFKNDKRSFVNDKFRSESSFNPRNKDIITEILLNC